MNASRVWQLVAMVLVVGLGLTACGSEPEPEAKAVTQLSAPKPKPAVAAAADPMAKMARAVGNGKPGSAVDIRFDFKARPEAGKPVEVEVVLIPSAGVDAMEATFGGMDGITLAGTLAASFTEVKPGQPYSHTISVLPSQNGVFYVTVTVNTQIGGATLGRTFSIPFVVGETVGQRKPAPAKDASGQAIESMKAKEKE